MRDPADGETDPCDATFRALVDSLPDIVMRFDRAGRHLFVSENTRRVTGLAAEQMVGRTHRELGFPGPMCVLWEDAIRRVFAEGTPFETEFLFDSESGPVVFDWRLIPERDATGGVRSVLSLARDITAVRRAESQYQTLFDKMLDGFALHEVVLDAQGVPVDYRFLSVNPAFERITGLSAAQVLGRTVLDVLPRTEPLWIERYGRVALTGEPVSFESGAVALGKRFFVTAFCPAPNQFACHFIDITARWEAERALRESELRLRLLYEDLPLGYQSLDEEGLLRDVNPRWLELLGHDRDAVLDRSFCDLLIAKDATRFRERLPGLFDAGGMKGLEFSIRRRDGGVATVAIDGRVAGFQDGRPRMMHCVLRDVTEERLAERESQRQQAILRQQQRLEAIGTLASGVAHEINSPLNVILNYSQMIEECAVGSDKIREFAANITTESERVGAIVRNLLGFARQGNDGPCVARILDVVDRTLSLTRSLLRRDRIEVVCEIPHGLPSVRCRPHEFQQVLMNLLTNARDAINERDPALAAARTVRIVAAAFEREEIPWVRLTVEDHGCGVPPEVADRLFDPFFSTKCRDKGTGLGLSISSGILKEHGGELWFESRPGEGARFHVDLRANGEAPAPVDP